MQSKSKNLEIFCSGICWYDVAEDVTVRWSGWSYIKWEQKIFTCLDSKSTVLVLLVASRKLIGGCQCNGWLTSSTSTLSSFVLHRFCPGACLTFILLHSKLLSLTCKLKMMVQFFKGQLFLIIQKVYIYPHMSLGLIKHL